MSIEVLNGHQMGVLCCVVLRAAQIRWQAVVYVCLHLWFSCKLTVIDNNVCVHVPGINNNPLLSSLFFSSQEQ